MMERRPVPLGSDVVAPQHTHPGFGPFPEGSEGEHMQDIIDAQARVIHRQNGLIHYYQDLLNELTEREEPRSAQ